MAKTKVIGVRVPEKTHKDFEKTCKILKRSSSDILREFIEGLNEFNVGFLSKLTSENVKIEFDQKRGIFTMKIGSDEIEAKPTDFLKFNEELQNEYGKIAEKLGNKYFKIKKLKNI